MAVPRSLTQIAFGSPLDESTEDEVLDPAVGFPVFQNIRQDHLGGASKRLGFDPLSAGRQDGTTRTAGRRTFAHKDLICVIDGATLDAYSATKGTSISAGRVPEATVEAMPLPAPVYDTYVNHDAAVANGVLVVAHSIGTAWRAIAVNATDGSQLLGPTLFGASPQDQVQLGSAGNSVLLVQVSYTGANVYLWALDCTSPATVAAGWILKANLSDKITSNGSISMATLTNRVAFAYINNSAGTSQITLKTADGTGILQTTTINTASLTPLSLAVGGVQTDTLWVAWVQGATVKACGVSPTTITTVLASTGSVGTPTGPVGTPSVRAGSTAGSGEALVSAGSGMSVVTWTTSGGVATAGSITSTAGIFPASVPFAVNGRRYAQFMPSGSNSQSATNTVVLVDYTTANAVRPIAQSFPGLTGSWVTSHPVTLPDGRIGYIVAVQTNASAFTYWLLKYNFADPDAWRPAFHNGVTFLSGGLLSYFDGVSVNECGILHPPMNLTATAGGGSGPSGTTISYVAVFQAVDAAGNLTWSGVSAPVAYSSASAVSVTLASSSLALTMRATVRICWYRNVNGGKVYYLVGSTDAKGATPTVTDTYDNTSTSALLSQPQLPYSSGVLPGTNGAALQHDAPPFCRDVVSYNGMLVVATRSDLWWSGQTVSGEGTWFSSEQFFVTVDGLRDVNALAVQDGTLYAFKPRTISVIAGDPPSDNGSTGGLGQPRLLASDVGCSQIGSIVGTSLGIFFRSSRGIELLPGGGRPQWVGQKVLRTVNAYPYVTSAKVDPYNSCVRFSLASGYDANGLVTGAGRDVVFDLKQDSWQSVDDKYGSVAHQASQDACIVTSNGASRYAWLGANGVVYVEGSSYLDNGTWISMSAETGWFKVAGIQGKQQLNRLLAMLRVRTASDLSVAIGYNYSTTYAAAQTWTDAQIQALLTAGYPITQLRHDPTNDALGQSVRIRVADATPTSGTVGTGQGATWLALTLDITPKDGPADVPEAAS